MVFKNEQSSILFTKKRRPASLRVLFISNAEAFLCILNFFICYSFTGCKGTVIS